MTPPDPDLDAPGGDPLPAPSAVEPVPGSSGERPPAPAVALRVVLDAAGIERAARRMAHEIHERHGDPSSLAVVAIARGGIPVARLLAECLGEICGTSVPVGELDVTLYRDDVLGRGKRPVPRRTRMPATVSGRRVVLVDDVVFTGRTIRAAMDAVLDFGRPQSIQVACLIDRGHREFPIQVDFVGKNIPTAHGERVLLRSLPDGQLEVCVQ